MRSLAMRPLRTAVLAVGFGLGIAVMAELLGVGEVILQQAHAPALAGGGDVVITGTFGPLESARFVMSSVLASGGFPARMRAASPSRRSTLYVLSGGGSIPVSVRGGIPSREAAIGDPEIAGQMSWTNTANDGRWISPAQGDLLRSMDRFHPVPGDAAAAGFSPRTWAEWLYFNGRSADGSLRFYLTFLAGGGDHSGRRPTFVRLQLNRGGTMTNYSAAADVDAGVLLDNAPDIDFGGNRVRLDADGTYRITLALARDSGKSRIPNPESRVSGDIVLKATAGRSIPPAAMHGARGWVSGYVVPVLSGTFSGRLQVDGEELRFDGAAGYHDHNWGFWEGVQWQWGQVDSGGMSIVYGRVFPPAEIADRDRVPGFLGVLGPDGPIAFSTNVVIREDDQGGSPHAITVQSRDRRVSLTLQFTVSEAVRTQMALTRAPGGTTTFLQLGGEYRVSGRAGTVEVNFTARGSAETFRY